MRSKKQREALGFEFERAGVLGLSLDAQLFAFKRTKRLALRRGQIGAAFVAAVYVHQVVLELNADPRVVARHVREVQRLSDAIAPGVRRRQRLRRRGGRERVQSSEELLETQVVGYEAARDLGILTPEQRREGYVEFTRRSSNDACGFFRLGLLLEDESDDLGAAKAFDDAERLAAREEPNVLAAIRTYTRSPKAARPYRSASGVRRPSLLKSRKK